MISRLKGVLEEKSKERVVVDVGGVGYGLLVPDTVLLRMPAIGEAVTLQVYTHVREDQLSLFGFLTTFERDVFEILLSANGVGPKLAIAVLSALDARQVLDAVVANNKPMLTSIPGIGKKTVEKLLLEIREKCEKRLLLERGSDSASNLTGKRAAAGASAAGANISWAADLEPALFALGYKENDVRMMSREVLARASDFKNFEEAIKFSLQHMRGNA